MDRFRDLVEQQLHEAMEQGEFDDLPGSGRPLPRGDDSPNWWARQKLEELKHQDRLIEVARELESRRDNLWRLPDEEMVREGTEEINRRIADLNPLLREDERLTPMSPEDAVATWRRMSRLRLL